MNLRIATRQSPLALWQARHVQSLLQAAQPDASVTLLPLTTSGDRELSQPLGARGGKGLFVKELEEALLDDRADLAVHSMKDVTTHLPAGLCLTAFLAAEDPRDAFVSPRFSSLADLPRGAKVGTASLRRRALLLGVRPDLELMDIRGNVGTRLRRLDEGGFDALVLACAGLHRLGLAARIAEALPVDPFLPAIGQGIIGIECRTDDAVTRRALEALNDRASETRLSAERALNAGLGGSCRAPVAGHAVSRGTRLALTGWVGVPDGSRSLRETIEGPSTQAAKLGAELARQLLAAGAGEMLASIGA